MTLKSYDPATGELVGEVTLTPLSDVSGIVARARDAFPAWRDLGLAARMERLLPLGTRLLERSDSIGELLTREMGKPLRDAVGEVRSCGDGLDQQLQEMVDALEPELLEDELTRTTLLHDPLGVCAAITPWNFPVAMPHWLVLPALMAGNTVVLKPSEETPLAAQAYADCYCDLLPEGVLQVVHGDETQGRALVDSDVDLVVFTGSREAGKQILAASSSTLKRVVLELGGKDPLVVLEDADIEKAVRFASNNAFRNAGQVCVSTERIYVHESVADRFETELAESASTLAVGNGLEPDTTIGPMINARQRDHVLGQIDEALSAGATLLAGGRPQGNFLRPTVLTGVTHAMSVMRDETFGPVVGVARVRDDDEAVRLANDTRFGLGAVVFGEVSHAETVARRLEAGMVGINRGVGGAQGSPWVGAKESGFGFHSGKAGHRQFTQVRILSRPKA